MPLPDERPRQSVANLIGRFENQTKRTPGAAQTPSRSSSVVSHTTGDSAKEELREKREWPPKSVTETAPPPAALPPSSFRFKPSTAQPDTALAVAEPLALTESAPNGSSEPPKVDAPRAPPDIPEPAPVQLQSKNKPVVTSKRAPSKTRTPSKPPTTSPRTPPSTAPKTTARTLSNTGKTPSKPLASPASSPPSQPLKHQNTGQSTISAVTKKPASKATPSTPARPKTPSRTAVTPSSRSSNLHAPTAASLARVRNAQSPTPTPPKKTISATASERLIKPTVASLSRARNPVTSPPATSPAVATLRATTPKPGVRGRTQGTPASTRGGKTPTTPSKTPTKKAPSSTSSKSPEAAAASTAIATAAVAACDASGVDQDVFPTKGASEAESQVEATPVPPSEPEPEPEVGSEIHNEEQPGALVVTEPEPEPESEVKVVISDEENGDAVLPHEDEVPATSTSSQAGSEIQVESKETEAEAEADVNVNGSAANSNGVQEVEEESIADPIIDKLTALASKHDASNTSTDIEQIVNLLETVPQPATKAASDTITPSELQEIPDEEH